MIEIPLEWASGFPYKLEDPLYLLMLPVAVWIIVYVVNKDFIRFKNPEEHKLYRQNKSLERKFVVALRSLAVAFLLIALASPYIEHIKEITGDPHVTVLLDNSSSFAIFENDVVDEVVSELENYMPVKIKRIGSSDRSNIGDEIINHMQGNGESILLVTDGWVTEGSTLDNVFTNAAISEATINTINIKPDKSDVAVRVEGPPQNFVSLTSNFAVIVKNVGDDVTYNLVVEVDNETVISKQGLSGSYTESFSDVLPQGYHTIRAYIEADDFFQQNNVYLKTVQILPKPKVLFVSEETSPLSPILSLNYNVVDQTEIPEDLSSYYSVILNDLSIDSISPRFDALNNYVADEGNGLVVIGGKNSYDKGGYKGTLFETLMPARVGTGIKSGASGVNVVIVIDASYSFRGEAIDYAKALAVDIIYNARLQDAVGVVAFRSGGGSGERTKTLVELTPMMNKSYDFEDKVVAEIGRIKGAGGTDIYAGLKRAEVLLQGKDNVNLIIISDGQQALNRKNTVKKAESLAERGFKIFTIGYSNAGLQDVDQDFLQDISDSGDGIYTGMDMPLPIEFIFEAGEEGKDDLEPKVTDQGEPLLTADPSHWIMQGLDLSDASVSGYNAIVPKKSARGLVYTMSGNNILAAWRFGLGRVVAYGTDDGRAWSGPVLTGTSSRIIPKMVNWAIEDPDRKEKFNVDLEDTRIGSKTIIRVHTDEKPELQDFVFYKTDEHEYTTEYYPRKREIRSFFGYLQAVNYPLEYRDVGMNPHFLNLVRKGAYRKGRIFEPENIEKMVEKIKEDSVMKEPVTSYWRWPFVLAALSMFLVEICIRRIMMYWRRH